MIAFMSLIPQAIWSNGWAMLLISSQSLIPKNLNWMTKQVQSYFSSFLNLNKRFIVWIEWEFMHLLLATTAKSVHEPIHAELRETQKKLCKIMQKKTGNDNFKVQSNMELVQRQGRFYMEMFVIPRNILSSCCWKSTKIPFFPFFFIYLLLLSPSRVSRVCNCM
jgi:hypothetical protein